MTTGRTIESLTDLLSATAALSNRDPCADGHNWKSEGGRACPQDLSPQCSQAVYVCLRCGEYDYGDIGGPGAADCTTYCKHHGETRDAQEY